MTRIIARAEKAAARRKPNVFFALLAGGFFLCGIPARAQELAISGTVDDGHGVVPGVAVTLRTPTGGKNETSTDAQGKYRFASLRSGPYELSFARDGFEKTARTLTLAGEFATEDVTLAIGGISSSVEVIDVAGKTTGSRMDIHDRDIPSQIGVVTQQTIHEHGLNDLATALENISGVSVQVQYGVYEWYTVDGFAQQSGNDFLYVDGMTLTGNRPQTQLDNVEEVQVLKGPNAVLYGGAGASQGGMVNIIRKKPQATRTTDLLYRVGRFGRNDVAGGTTGSVFGLQHLLYRIDAGFSYADGWRNAGAKRLNVSPDLLWLINNRMRIVFNESFSHDHYDMDAGVPLGVLAIPNFPLNRRFNPPQDFERFDSWQNHIVYSANLTNRLELRNSFFHAMSDDQYLDAETLSYVAASNTVNRTELYYMHHRRPMQNQADILGTYDLFGMRHKFLIGYDYEDQYNFTDRTTPVGTTSISNIVIAPISLTAFLNPGYVDPSTPQTSFPRARRDYTDQAINAAYWQDQINVSKRLRINVAGRYDDWKRRAHNDPYTNGVFVSRGPDTGQVHQTAHDYRAGAVYSIFSGYEWYFSSANSFHPVNTIPADNSVLLPGRSRSYEVGQKWQVFRRLNVNAALRRIIYYNLLIPLGAGLYDQAGKADSNVADLDIDGDLGHGIHALAAYGYALARYDDYKASATGASLAGNMLVYAPHNTSKAWLTKRWKLREGMSFTSSFGARYMGWEFLNTTNTTRVGGFLTFSGIVGLQRGHFEGTVNAENLFNRQRYFVSQINNSQLYPGQPINVFGTVRYRF
jgi:iron complex outermembrane recepter protein